LWMLVMKHSIAELHPFLNAYLDPDSLIAHPKPLVSGKTLMDSLSLLPGPHIGELLTALELAQADGKIKTSEQAIALAQKWHTQPEKWRQND
jgi:tRNA nucleotidyltransferase (CCA-adding enzyme)